MLPPSQWRGYLETRAPEAPHPTSWGACPPLPSLIEQASANVQDGASITAIVASLGDDPQDAVALQLASLARARHVKPVFTGVYQPERNHPNILSIYPLLHRHPKQSGIAASGDLSFSACFARGRRSTAYRCRNFLQLTAQNRDGVIQVNHQYEKHGRGMMEDDRSNEAASTKALAMLDAFASVGVTVFDLTVTNITEDERGRQEMRRYEANQGSNELRRRMPRMIEDADRQQNNNIIRPHNPAGVTVIQLDDLDSDKIERLVPHSFMVICTSPGNHQAWIAVNDAPVEKEAAKDFVRRFKKRTGADATASGATRTAGGFNFKLKYAPAFPCVEITHLKSGHVTSCAALEQAGLVAPPEAPRPPLPAYTRSITPSGRPSRKKWPSYAFCLQHAPMSHGDDRPDISRADFTWCRTAIEWGWGIADTASRLMQLSSKAKENGESYAMLTATNAAASVERQPYRGRSTPRPA